MIGEVLIKAYQNWYKGGGFKLKNNIKKANKEFQIFREILKEFKELNGETLKAIQDNKQLFLKEFPRIKNILKTHQDYQPILDNIFHNFNYFIKNFDLIEEWLLSDDFKEKYKKKTILILHYLILKNLMMKMKKSIIITYLLNLLGR
ncbi:hypothetical protein THJ114_13830 [Campylobacter jejuni]|nr:hypothetical protein THJ114_13830 [Campylobacter jejuni]